MMIRKARDLGSDANSPPSRGSFRTGTLLINTACYAYRRGGTMAAIITAKWSRECPISYGKHLDISALPVLSLPALMVTQQARRLRSLAFNACRKLRVVIQISNLPLDAVLFADVF